MKTIHTLFALALVLGITACKAETETNKTAVAIAEATATVSKKHTIKVALLLDTSNSMDGLIDQAKAQLWEIVNELSQARSNQERPNLEIALYEYGNDGLSEGKGFIRKIISFTDDLDTISKELFSLTTNGGSEYCGTVIKASLDDLEWGKNEDDLKMIFIAGNESFTQGKIHYKDAAADAKEKGIVVNTIFCGNFKQGVDSNWEDGAILTYGDYMAIDHNQHTVHVASPYDDLILQLNIQLNQTYVPYGTYGRNKIALQEEQDDNAVSYSKANAVSRTISKGSHLYKNETWDLVDAEKEKDFDYSKLKKEELPDNLKGKTTAQIKSYVEKQGNERARIQDEIATLTTKRRNYITKNKGENSNALESAMIQVLKKQAKRKNYTWQ
ncbi:vWA domain-containing protein [Rasiella sp. SM2506]|uniref:vWA domain-containing protein n=1 Tax=Rasiella sp. SM2506 TaxID=3423914 RepID=UPI003D7B3C1C